MEKVKDLFWSKVKKSKSCWIWIASLDTGGYGSFGNKITKKIIGTRIASRIAYFFENGKIPKGKFVLHRCDNTKCVKPSHLFIGTQKDNVRDMEKKGRSRHLKGDDHGSSKLTSIAVRWIRKNKDIFSCKKMAKKYHVHQSTIKKIKQNLIWTSV
jgi:hypothetical protein